MRELIWSVSKKDLRIDTFRAGGPGGQKQNKTDSAVRITHIETGLSAESRTATSQHQNRKLAFRKLAKKLIAHFDGPDFEVARSKERIRSYNQSKQIVVDHESGLKLPWNDVMNKDGFDKMIEARRTAKQ